MPESKLHGENLIAIPDVPDYLPTRRGKKLHISTVYRWVLKGARGKVLDSAMLGGIRYTSLEALERFLGTRTAELTEIRRQERVRASLDRRGLSSPRIPEARLPVRDVRRDNPRVPD
ncbi:hypothetical protein Pla123a_44520 [Posidoniimonas polymericola]|uniref:DUF1580 domain-containing protein n=1 Tax=Posidoniimonas polymericola TaxID=2528002 RepID=A0A5C5Y057_9BACT|nr:DUF1580 domain-containing protein [Posidoniimonas polymericola]TWT67022.1 hypothetical protein Pla123a_44520 [Posidoniimonas polymericola]